MIFNMTGGGSGSGATLVVSCPANVTVTVSKDDKSYTKNSGNLGSATFKGLATGEWTVTIEGNEQTATKNITITADYAITMAFFAAYINITYPANSNCVVTNSGGQTVASDTNTGSSTKKWTATVGATGTYTVTATSTSDSSKTKSTTVDITTDGQSESVMLSYKLYLYNKGDECTDITGGWGGTNPSTYFRTGTVTKNADNINVSISSMQQIFAHTKNKISLTGINTIYANILGASVSDINKVVNIFAVNTTIAGSYAAFHVLSSNSKGYISIDVSALEGDYYVFFQVASETYYAYVNFDEVYME